MRITPRSRAKEAVTNRNHFKGLLVFLTAVTALSGCETGYVFPNEAPSQLSIEKESCYVIEGEEVSLVGIAFDEDGDPIYYQWSATAGSFEPPDGKGSSVIWEAPQTPGPVTITLSVTDEIETSSTHVTIEVGGIFPGTINQATTIADSGYVYLIDKLLPVSVPSGVSLTLSEGVRIVVRSENGGIDVAGSLIVEGTEGNEVVIGPSSCEPGEGDWNGVRVVGLEAEASITHARIYAAENGLVVSGQASAVVRHSTINNNSNNGVEVSDGATLDMYGCTVWDNGTGVYVRNSRVDFSHNSIRYNDINGLEVSATSEESEMSVDSCVVANNETYGILLMGIARPEIHYCSIFSNGSGGEGEAVRLEVYSGTDSVRVDYNFWGIGNDSEEAIRALIYDKDDTDVGVNAYVDFIPWLADEPEWAP